MKRVAVKSIHILDFWTITTSRRDLAVVVVVVVGVVYMARKDNSEAILRSTSFSRP